MPVADHVAPNHTAPGGDGQSAVVVLSIGWMRAVNPREAIDPAVALPDVPKLDAIVPFGGEPLNPFSLD